MRATDTIPHPSRTDYTLTIQQLPGRHTRRAREVFFNHLVEGIVERGGAKTQQEMQALFAKKAETNVEAEVAKVQADPLNGYDIGTLVRFGVLAWSCPEPLTPEALADLSEEDEEVIARAVLKLTKPTLFQTPAEQAVAQKNV